MISRSLNLLTILDKTKSVLLLGPRGTGKTALIDEVAASWVQKKSAEVVRIDLLQGGDFQRYLVNPSLLTSELSSKIERQSDAERSFLVCIDEVQKVPQLLDEVHHLIEKYKGRILFLLSGSSARKLRRGGANLLAGRAISCHLFPLNQLELNLTLSRALQFGTLPAIYLDDQELEILTLESYVTTYLKEEIQQESLVRGIERFSRFLELAAQNNGLPINFSKLSKQIGIAGKTVAEYYSILTDTLVATQIPGWSESVKRQLLQAPRYYFFDCGVLNALNGYLRIELREGGYLFGNLFETFIVNQLIAVNSYQSLGLKFYYWRDKAGREVDLIVARNSFEPLLAIEIKTQSAPTAGDCPGFEPFSEEYPKIPKICLCRTPRAYEGDGIKFLPWGEFLGEVGISLIDLAAR